MGWAFFFLIFVAIVLLPLGILSLRKARSQYRTGPGPSPWLFFLGTIPAILFFLILQGPPDEIRAIFGLMLLAVLAMAVFFWIHELIALMGLGDEAFPGRHDKVLWFALMVLLPPVGAITFSMFRRAYWPVEKPSREAAHDFL